MSVIVDARNWSPLYKSGIYTNCSQGPFDKSAYNHAVIAVALDANGIWTIKNSWGKEWGVNGHMQLPSGNPCGISDLATVP